MVKFAYIAFLSIWSAVIASFTVMQACNVWKKNEAKAVASDFILIIFFIGLLAQFIADGIRVIGG